MNEEFGLPPVEASPADEIAELKRQLAESNAKLAAATKVEPGPDLDSMRFPRKYVHLEIAVGRNADDMSYVSVGINGHVWRIQRGVKVVVHEVAAKVLDQAVENVTVSGDGGLITRPALRFPYTSSPATEAEYLAYQAEMRDQKARSTVMT